jgi:hypothetical protein
MQSPCLRPNETTPRAGRGKGIAGAVLAAVFALALESAAVPPDEGDCPAVTGVPGRGADGVDAAPILIKTGMKIRAEDLLLLRSLLPPEIWRHREVFFHEGMSMEIGPCHRRYAIPSFYEAATQKFSGQPKLDADGNLESYTAGVPFPPAGIDPKAPDAATKWAWNLENRFRGAGFSGRFRIVDYPTRIGTAQTYEGVFFMLQTSARSDHPDDGYHLELGSKRTFIAGGEFKKPFDARFLSWRQMRPADSREAWQTSDDTFVYVPTMRKVRRASSGYVDGLYFPSYGYSGDSGGGGMAFGDPMGGGSASINPTASQSSATTVHVERGLTGISLRPNAYVWRYKGERDILAPINLRKDGFPGRPDRNFGFSGLSLASDTWDVRRAVVIEGALLERNSTLRTVTIYIDYQTLQPLYWITRTDRRRLLNIGILAHRFSGDVFDYPDWPGGKQAAIFEPVAASFYNALAGRGGWRRESFDLRSIPFSASKRRFMSSANALMRNH